MYPFIEANFADVYIYLYGTNEIVHVTLVTLVTLFITGILLLAIYCLMLHCAVSGRPYIDMRFLGMLLLMYIPCIHI